MKKGFITLLVLVVSVMASCKKEDVAERSDLKEIRSVKPGAVSEEGDVGIDKGGEDDPGHTV